MDPTLDEPAAYDRWLVHTLCVGHVPRYCDAPPGTLDGIDEYCSELIGARPCQVPPQCPDPFE